MCQINTSANITSMGESIFFLVSTPAKCLAVAYVITHSKWGSFPLADGEHAVCVQCKEQFGTGRSAGQEKASPAGFAVHKDDLCWKYPDAANHEVHLDPPAYVTHLSLQWGSCKG